jgi:glycosyltransferase involved in cell wall biosynthesis
MRILIYGHFFLPVVGGVQTLMRHLAQGLVDLNEREGGGELSPIEVTVVTMTPAQGMDDSALPYRVVRQPNLWRLTQLIRESSVLHVAGPCLLPLAIAWLARKPTIVEHHGYQANCPNGLLLYEPDRSVCPGHFLEHRYGECLRCCSQSVGRTAGARSLLLTFLRRWFCKHVAGNIAITDHVGKRLKLERTRTIYYGIEEFVPSVDRNSGGRSRILQIASVGRLVTEKGLPLLLEASRSLKEEGAEFSLAFVGDGPERSHLEEMVVRFGLSDRVMFTGDLTGPVLDQALSEVDVVVMPSIWEETAGLSAIEQMMRGRLVVAADIGGLGEIVGGAALKFPPGDSQALASCLRRLIQDPSLVSSLGLAASNRARRLFNRDRMIQAHLSFYRDIWSQLQSRNR